MNNEDKIQRVVILPEKSILKALKKMDVLGVKSLMVVDSERIFNGVLSIGDIQRAILRNETLDTKIASILRPNPKVGEIGISRREVKNLMSTYRMEFLPVLDTNKKLVDCFFWEAFFPSKQLPINTNLDIPVVIMAGGMGTRLKPLTNVFPKPLLPIGDKTIIEEIMDRFTAVGCHQFHLSVNYKADTIKHYFHQLNSDSYNIDYFQEEKPLGTAGSLYLIKDKINSTFFVSNCDIIVEEDYSEIYRYHKENKNELTIVSALKHYPIPYGTIKTIEDGMLNELIEKPELTFQINTGFYILEPHLLKEIPENEFFHITTLIENIQKREGRVGVFPISEGSWKDIGEWNEYVNLINT